MRYKKPLVVCSICGKELTKNGFTGHMKYKHPDKYEVFMKDKSAFMLPVEDNPPTEPEPVPEPIIEPVVEPAPAPAPTPEVNESATADAFPESTTKQKKGFRLFRRRTN